MGVWGCVFGVDYGVGLGEWFSEGLVVGVG